MAARDVETLDALFHEKSVFVHMDGAWGKAREMEIIKSGDIYYKEADIHEVSVNSSKRVAGSSRRFRLPNSLLHSSAIRQNLRQ
ncbi:nuclear transport factor 2 family protein [Caldilinea sp.]|uniref:nuclear transport factor 2 family protein n=1 Tax=Caldilinea sp. TaxID=2293560 RepID=UPI0031CCD028